MLEHEQPETATLPAAAEKRVTSEEFARAVAAIEARKADQAKNLAGTLPIGQGIHELGLDASPEEVWAEVEAQRARAHPQQVTPPQFDYQTKPVVAVTPPRQGSRRRRRWIALGIFFFLFGLSRHAFFHSADTHTTPTATVSATAPVVRTLHEIPDNHLIFCDTATLRQIIQGADPRKITVREEKADNDWPLVKHAGQVYLCGYILPTSAEAIENTGIHLYNDDNAGELEGVEEGRLTVPVKHMHLDNISGNNAWTEIMASQIRLDAHAFEDWSDDD